MLKVIQLQKLRTNFVTTFASSGIFSFAGRLNLASNNINTRVDIGLCCFAIDKYKTYQIFSYITDRILNSMLFNENLYDRVINLRNHINEIGISGYIHLNYIYPYVSNLLIPLSRNPKFALYLLDRKGKSYIINENIELGIGSFILLSNIIDKRQLPRIIKNFYRTKSYKAFLQAGISGVLLGYGVKPLTLNTSGHMTSSQGGRKNNEDSGFIATLKFSENNTLNKITMIGVADGVGGLQGGEVASNFAIRNILDTISYYFLKTSSISVNHIYEAYEKANRQIYEYAISRNRNMATTLTMGILENNTILIGHVGDSRAYMSTNSIYRLTTDHKLAPHSHVITKAIGHQPSIDPDIRKYETIRGSYLIFTTDGLTDVVKDSEIFSVINSYKYPNLITKQLVSLAEARKSRDNITVAILKI